MAAVHSRDTRTTDCVREPIGARHLLPDGQAQRIRPVEIPRVLDLLVLAHAVEPHFARDLHVAAQRVIVRRRQAPAPANIPDRAPCAGCRAVRSAGTDRLAHPQSEARYRTAPRRSTRRDPPTVQASLDQVRRVRAPQQLVAGIVDAGIGQRDAAMDFATDDVVGVGGERGLAAAQLDRRGAVPAGAGPPARPRTPISQRARFGVNAMRPMRVAGTFRARPSARYQSCVDTRSNAARAASPACHAAWRDRAGHLLRAPRFRKSRRQESVTSKLKGVYPPSCPPADAVDPDRRPPVDGAEMQHPTLSGHALRQLTLLAIPAGPEESGVPDAAGRCLRREWNADLFTPVDLAALTPDAIRVEGEIPRPVEGYQ